MQGLADELRVSRVTLFRQAGNREDLLSNALWKLTSESLATASARWEAERLPDDLHTSGTGRCFNAIVAKTGWLTSLLADESVLVIRLLTDPRGQVQTGVVNFFEALLQRDMREFDLTPLIELGTLAFALVRLGEAFMYADVLASREPDIVNADRLQQALCDVAWSERGARPPPTP